jgi:hypothetical protein
MGTSSISRSEGSELRVSGPLCLSSDEPEALTWLAKAGSLVVGWVKLCRGQHTHVGVLRELRLSESARAPMAVAARLCSSVFEYARDHGLLKLKIHRDCAHECLHTALAHAGFSHDQRDNEGLAVQVYVDLYRSPRTRLTREPSDSAQSGEIRMAC